MKTAKQHNAPMVGEVKVVEPSERTKEELGTIALLGRILTELQAIREQLKTEVVIRDKHR